MILSSRKPQEQAPSLTPAQLNSMVSTLAELQVELLDQTIEELDQNRTAFVLILDALIDTLQDAQ